MTCASPDTFKKGSRVSKPLTPLQEAYNSIERAALIGIDRGMNGDEAIERCMAAIHWAKRAQQLLKPEVQRQGNAEPVGYMAWWGVGKMQPSWPPYKTREEAVMYSASIKSPVVIRPVYDASVLGSMPSSPPVHDGYIQFEGVDDTLEVMQAKELLKRNGYTITRFTSGGYAPDNLSDNKVRYAGKNDPIVGNPLMHHALPPDPVEFGNIQQLAG